MKIVLILKLLLPLIAGVVVRFYIPFNLSGIWFFIIIVALALLSIPFFSRKKKLRFLFGGGTTVLFFLLGVYLSQLNVSSNNSTYFFSEDLHRDAVYQIELTDFPEEKANSIKCFATVKAVNEKAVMGKVLLYFKKSENASNLKYGDVLCLKTRFNLIRPNGNPKEFDYARYLRIHNVVHQGYVKDEDWKIVGEKGNFFFSWMGEVRNYLGQTLEKSGLSASNLMVARALILGEKESLDRETLRTFSSAGAMHVLAVSGLHVGIVMLIFSFLLKPLKRFSRGQLYYVIAVITAIWFYASLTGLSSSVLRASVMFTFVILGKEIERDTSVYQSILVSAFLLILIEPYVIFQVGFQLSYLAVLGIVFLQPKIYNLVYTKYFILDKVWQISSVSLAAQIATFPLGLYYFHQFPNFFMISNLIVIPLAFAILIVGMTYFVTAWIPVFERICFFVLDIMLSMLNWGVAWIEQLPYSIYWGVSIMWFEVFWLYVIIVLTIFSFTRKNKKMVYATLIAVCGLLLYNVFEKSKLNSSNELVIYSVNKSIAIDLFYGRENLFIADDKLIGDEDKLLFHVKHNWFYRSGNEHASKVLALNEVSDVLAFGNDQLFLLNENCGASIPQTTMVYLSNIEELKEGLINDLVKRDVSVIVGDGVGFKLRKLLKETVRPNKLHILNEDGAFVYPFL